MAMAIDPARVEAVFSEAVGKATPAERAAYLNEACGGDRDLRRRVEALLAAHDPADSFLSPPAGLAATIDQPLRERPGAVIGRYKLLQLIGEGGFGSVFMAQQDHPVRRTVALKVIKLGMDTKQVMARFEAERQALAMMDHPNIARVLDAAATDTGRPYFVMELVRGVPITEYCDTNNLATRERLELFIPVCHAVQHAHQKGVIHRDIKPSNILVTIADGRPIPKVIDFGIAKATNARLTEMTLFTEYRQMVGTPAYMSPEQAEMTGIDVDTRSDVYSLGVLLYELLTGTTPFDPKELRSKAYAEIQRMIREVEPPRPSTRISGLGKTLATTAARRSAEPRKLGQLMRGELDWVVMKCLEKDRTRRYETANGLAVDVRRYLSDEAVQARPTSAAYRTTKFVRKHRAGVSAAGAIAAALVLGILGTTAGLIRATNERDRVVGLSAELNQQRREALDARARAEAARAQAEAARAQAERDRAATEVSEEQARGNLTMMRIVFSFVGDMITAADADRDPDVTVREMLDRTVAQIDGRKPAYLTACESAIRQILGTAYQGVGRPAEAEAEFRKVVSVWGASANHPWAADGLRMLGALLAEQSRFDEALPPLERALGIYRAADVVSPDVLATLFNLQRVNDAKGRRAEAEQYAREAAELRARLGLDESVVPLANALAQAYARIARQDYPAAELHLREALDLHRQLKPGQDDRTLIAIHHHLGLALREQGRDADAETAFGQALAASEKLLGRDHPETATTLGNLAAALRAQHKEDEARATEIRWLAVQARVVTDAIRQSPDDASLYFARSKLLCRAGRFREALPDFHKAIELDPNDHLKYFLAAPVYLYEGDVEGYHRFCREMVQRFHTAEAPKVGELIVKASLIGPDPNGDPELFARLIGRAVAQGQSNQFSDWFKTTQGLAEYRRGRYEQAVKAVEGLPEKGRMPAYGRGLAGLVLAMGHAGAGRTDQARRTLAEAEARFDALRMTPGASDLTTGFNDWCIYQIILSQARSAVNAPPQRSQKQPANGAGG